MFGYPPGSGGRPVWRGLQFILVTFALASGYILFGAYVNWPPFYQYPAVGSTNFVLIWIFAIIGAWAIDFGRFAFMKPKDSQMKQNVTR